MKGVKKGWFRAAAFLKGSKKVYHNEQFPQPLVPDIRDKTHTIRTIGHELFTHICQDDHLILPYSLEHAIYEAAKNDRQPFPTDLDAKPTIWTNIDFVRNNITNTWEGLNGEDTPEKIYIDDVIFVKYPNIPIQSGNIKYYNTVRQVLKEYPILLSPDGSAGKQLSTKQLKTIIQKIPPYIPQK